MDIKQFPLAEQVKEVTEPLQDVYIHMQFPEGSGMVKEGRYSSNTNQCFSQKLISSPSYLIFLCDNYD